MVFSQIIGNDSVKSNLLKIIEEGLVANTLLFHGPDGVGKSLFAKELAYVLMYPQKDPLQKNKIYLETHPDLHIYKPEGKTEMHSIASIRQLIKEVFMQPFEAKAKVFIIHDAERMLPSNSNALLKTLEEPTLDSYIILLSSKIELILPTIISRCLKISFSSLTDAEIIKLLQDKKEKSLEEAKQIATMAQGCVSRAFYIASHPNYNKKKEILIRILSNEGIYSYSDLLDSLAELDQQEDEAERFKDIDLIFTKILMWFRDLHLIKENADEKYIFFSEYIDFLKKQNLSNLPSLKKIHEWIEEAHLGIERNMKLKTALSSFFLKLNSI